MGMTWENSSHESHQVDMRWI